MADLDVSRLKPAGGAPAPTLDVSRLKPADAAPTAAQPNPTALPGTPDTMSTPEVMAKNVQQRMFQIFDDISGRIPSVDYKAGTGYNDQVALDRSDSDMERFTYLSNKYGEDNVFQDPGGRFYVLQGDKRFVAGVGSGDTEAAVASAKEGNIWNRPMTGLEAGITRFGAGAQAYAPEILGSAGALALMPETGGLSGLLLGTAASSAGAMAGKGYDEAWKWLQGFYRKTPSEGVKAINEAGVAGGLGQFAGDSIIGATKFLRRGYSPWIEQPVKDLTADALRRKMVPPVAAALPNAKILKFEQSYLNAAFGNPAQKGNARALRNELKYKLVQAGMTPADADAEIKAITAKRVETHLEGQGLMDEVKKRVAQAETQVAQGTQTITKQLDSDLAGINARLGTPRAPGAIHGDVAAAIDAERTKFSTNMSALYQPLDAAAGQPLYPTAGVKKAAADLLESLPKTEGTPAGTKRVQVDTPRGKIWRVVKTPASAGKPIFSTPEELAYIRNLTALPDQITFQEAQRIRSKLFIAGLPENLTPGVESKEITGLATAVDAGFEQAAIDTPIGSRLTKALRSADDAYRDGIQKFKDLSVNRLVNDAGQRGAVEPEKVVATIIRPGYADATKRIWPLLSHQAQRDVASADWHDMITVATDPATGKVSGLRLLRQLEKREENGQLSFVHGKQGANDMLEYARGLAALNEGADPQIVQTANLRGLIVQTQLQQKALDAFMKDNYLSQLAKTNKFGDEAFDFVLKEGQGDRLLTAKEFFGEASPQWQGIKEKAMAKLFERSMGDSGNPLEFVFKSNGLKRALSPAEGGFSPRQLDILFGEETRKDLYQLADTIEFMNVKGPGKFAGGLAAGTLMIHALSHPAHVAEAYVWNRIMSTPGFIRWLNQGLRGDTASMRKAISIIRATASATAQSSRPDTRAGFPHPPQQ